MDGTTGNPAATVPTATTPVTDPLDDGLDTGLVVDPSVGPLAVTAPVTAITAPVAAGPNIITTANIKPFAAEKSPIVINYDAFVQPLAGTDLGGAPNLSEILAKNLEIQNSAYRDAIAAELMPLITAWHNNPAPDKGPLELPPITGNRENLKASEHYKIYAAAAHIALQSAGITKPEDIAKVQITPSSDTKEENDGLNQGMASFTKIIEDGLAADQDLSNKALEKAITIHPDRKTKYQSFEDEASKLSAAKATAESLDAFKRFLETQSSEDAVKGDTSLNIVNNLLSKVLSPKEPPSPASAEDTQKYADALTASKNSAQMELFAQDVMQKFSFLGKDPIEANKETEAGNILTAFTALAGEHEAFKDVILAEQKKYTDDLATAKVQAVDPTLAPPTASPTTAGAPVDPVKIEVDPKTKENVEKVKAAATLVGSVALCATAACFFPPIGVLLIVAGAAWFMNRGKGEAKEAEEAAKLAAEEEALKAADPDRGLTAKEYLAKLEAEKAGNVALDGQANAPSLTGSAAARATNALAEELDKDLAKVIKTLTAAKESLEQGEGINNKDVIETLTATKESLAVKKGGAFSDADTVDLHDIANSLDSALELINSDGVGVTKPSPKDLLDNTLKELEKTAKARADNTNRTKEDNWQERVTAARGSQQSSANAK